MSFLTVCLNPTLQKTLSFSSVFPGTVNRALSHRFDVSGKGINVTRVLTQLGKKALHLTQLGGEMRPLFLLLCKQDGLVVEWVESGSDIRFCYTILTECDVTELVEESETVGSGTEELLLSKYDNLIASGVKWLIISGTKAAGFSDTLIPNMVRNAKNKGIKIILDVKGKDLIESLPYEPDIIKPNLYEFAATFTAELVKDNDLTALDSAARERIQSAALEISHKYNCRVILTNGNSAILAVDNNIFFETPVPPVKTVNTIGCGDAFTAGLAAFLDEGSCFNEAIAKAARCASMNASLIRPGVIR
jgi:1-phosphofructokinase family hexose kinase